MSEAVIEAPFTFKNGDRYVGQWVDGMKHGFGVAVYECGNHYTGYWSSDAKSGDGRIVFTDGSSYCGQWKDDKKHGIGIATFASGNRYEGEYVADVMSGKGTLFYSNGDVYAGEWKDNQIHGAGVWTSGNELSQYEGNWSNGQRAGNGIVRCGHIAFEVVYTNNAVTSKTLLDESDPRCALASVPAVEADPPEPAPPSGCDLPLSRAELQVAPVGTAVMATSAKKREEGKAARAEEKAALLVQLEAQKAAAAARAAGPVAPKRKKVKRVKKKKTKKDDSDVPTIVEDSAQSVSEEYDSDAVSSPGPRTTVSLPGLAGGRSSSTANGTGLAEMGSSRAASPVGAASITTAATSPSPKNSVYIDPISGRAEQLPPVSATKLQPLNHGVLPSLAGNGIMTTGMALRETSAVRMGPLFAKAE